MDKSLSDMIQEVQARFKKVELDIPQREVKMMIKDVCGAQEEDLIVGDVSVSAEQEERLDNIVERRIAGEPLTRILGVREFWGLEFEVTPDTLDPRPDTETLVESALGWALKKAPCPQAGGRNGTVEPFRILDMGTGTGCVLIALLSELPQATGVAADISPQALAIARRNAEKNKMSSRIDFVESDWMSALGDQQFDLIVSNPPYIVESVIDDLDIEVKNHDPILALSGGNDGLDCYKKIIFDLKNHLNGQNRAFLEIGFDQLEALKGLVEESGLSFCDSYADLSGIPRVVEISNGDK